MVVRTTGEVWAYFRKPGEHWYTVTTANRPGEPFRGTVLVRGARTGFASNPSYAVGPMRYRRALTMAGSVTPRSGARAGVWDRTYERLDVLTKCQVAGAP